MKISFKNIEKKDGVQFNQLSFPIDTSFEQTIFVDTPLIGSKLNQIEKSHGEYLNHWVGVLMHITLQTRYDPQYLIMRLSGYINTPTEPDFITIKQGMEYLTHHTHEPIMY